MKASYVTAWLLCFCYLPIISFARRPNIVLILTDDQDQALGGGFEHMNQTQQLLLKQGTQIGNAFVSTPVCCPSRSSIVTGRYIHNTGTYNNTAAGGCSSEGWRKGAESQSMGVLMQQWGYNTGYMGKYMNQYGEPESGTGPSYVPPGWSQWLGLVGNSRYYNYTLSRNGVAEVHGDNYATDYLTDLLSREAVSFINQYTANTSTPFFLTVATPATHRPDTPAPQYSHLFPSLQAPRGGTFNQWARDKHWLLRAATPELDSNAIAGVDNLYRHRLRALQSVDDLVSAVVGELERAGVLDNTYLIYTSDHGYHLGQNRQHGEKRQPYDTNTRVPWAIRGPGVPVGVIQNTTAVSVDLVPTILDFAGATPPANLDGISLKYDILEPAIDIDKAKPGHQSPASVGQDRRRSNTPAPFPPIQDYFLIEYFGESNNQSMCPGCYCDHGTPGVDAGFFIHDCHNNTFTCLRVVSPAIDRDDLFCNFYANDDPTRVDANILMSEYYLHANDTRVNNIDTLTQPQVEGWRALIDHDKSCKGLSCRVTRRGPSRGHEVAFPSEPGSMHLRSPTIQAHQVRRRSRERSKKQVYTLK